MKTRILFFLLTFIFATSLNAQYWSKFGNSDINPDVHKLGTTNNYPIPFYTSNTQRMRLYSNQTSTINGFPGINQDGYLMLSRDPNLFNSSAGPLSLLHLAGTDGWLEFSFRPWMKDGITFTSNLDAAYIGLKEISSDQTEMVVNWGDNAGPSPGGADDMVFRFTQVYEAGNTNDQHPASLDGLQVMRLTGYEGGRVGVGNAFSLTDDSEPQRKLHVHDSGANNTDHAQMRLSYDLEDKYADFRVTNDGDLSIRPIEINSGITSFKNVGIHEFNPSHTLHVNGDLRVEDVPEGANEVLITGKEESGDGDYSLSYLEFNGDENTVLSGDGTWVDMTGTGEDDCDWKTDGTNVWTGVSGDECLPPKNVGIGTSTPGNNKVFIRDNGSVSGNNVAQRIQFLGETGTNWGQSIWISSNPQDNTQNFGTAVRCLNSLRPTAGLFHAIGGGDYSVGIEVRGEGAPNQNFGVYASALGGTNNYAVYGQANGEGSFAGYFAGGLVSGPIVTLSDSKIKKDVKVMDGMLDKVMALQPKTYKYDFEKFPQLGLEEGLSHGFIAQELEEIFPDMVEDATSPTKFDEEGNKTMESVDLKGVQYTEMIPVLVSAMQEQQEIINKQQAQIDRLAAMVESCCSSDRNANQNDLDGYDLDIQVTKSELEQNFPNPFKTQTSITYTVGCNCNAKIVIYDQAGRTISTITDEAHDAGVYTIDWDASRLDAGIYFYALIVDGQEFVKKAVKL